LNTREIGNLGEELALKWYLERGYLLVCRNFHFHKLGELDIVLYDETKELLCVCEVKLRKSREFGGGAIAVNFKKQMTIRKVTEGFLMAFPKYRNKNIRFDVAEVYTDSNSVDVIEGAF